jgi:hypothetical protein
MARLIEEWYKMVLKLKLIKLIIIFGGFEFAKIFIFVQCLPICSFQRQYFSFFYDSILYFAFLTKYFLYFNNLSLDPNSIPSKNRLKK